MKQQLIVPKKAIIIQLLIVVPACSCRYYTPHTNFTKFSVSLVNVYIKIVRCTFKLHTAKELRGPPNIRQEAKFIGAKERDIMNTEIIVFGLQWRVRLEFFPPKTTSKSLVMETCTLASLIVRKNRSSISSNTFLVNKAMSVWRGSLLFTLLLWESNVCCAVRMLIIQQAPYGVTFNSIRLPALW